LCKRAIEPRYGKWTLPAGFMENGETVAEAASREAVEEAEASVVDLELYGLFNITHVNQVYIMFRGRLEREEFGPGTESLEVKLVGEQEVPWDDLAFPVIRRTLDLYFEDRRRGRFGSHMLDIPSLRQAGWRR
jgi:ADP-ribose pyrophosphatase YjhB (NUDIX family)